MLTGWEEQLEFSIYEYEQKKIASYYIICMRYYTVVNTDVLCF